MSDADFVNIYIENIKKALFDEIAKHLITKSQLDIANKAVEELTAKVQRLEAKNKKSQNVE